MRDESNQASQRIRREDRLARFGLECGAHERVIGQDSTEHEALVRPARTSGNARSAGALIERQVAHEFPSIRRFMGLEDSEQRLMEHLD